MRELTVRLRFRKHCLGNVKERNGSGRFLMPRSPEGAIIFMPTWHGSNMRLAAQLLGRYQDSVDKIFWDIVIDGALRLDPFFRRYYGKGGSNNKQRFALHEAFFPGQVIGVHCAVPGEIGDDDFRRLMNLAGQYKGLSPYRPREYGFYDVERILARRAPPADEGPMRSDDDGDVVKKVGDQVGVNQLGPLLSAGADAPSIN